MKTNSIILVSLLLLTFTEELKAQVPYYSKYVLEYKFENGKIDYKNTDAKKIDTTFYFETINNYVKGSHFKKGTTSYKYQISDSEIVDGEIDFLIELYYKPTKIKPEPSTLKYNSEKYRYILSIKKGKDVYEYVFKPYSFLNLTYEETVAEVGPLAEYFYIKKKNKK